MALLDPRLPGHCLAGLRRLPPFQRLSQRPSSMDNYKPVLYLMAFPSSLAAQAVTLLYMSNVSRFVPRVWPPTRFRVLPADRQEDRRGEVCQGWGVPVAREHPEQRETHLRRDHDQRAVDFNRRPLLCRRSVSTRGKQGQTRHNGLVTFLLGGVGCVCPWGQVHSKCD